MSIQNFQNKVSEYDEFAFEGQVLKIGDAKYKVIHLSDAIGVQNSFEQPSEDVSIAVYLPKDADSAEKYLEVANSIHESEIEYICGMLDSGLDIKSEVIAKMIDVGVEEVINDLASTTSDPAHELFVRISSSLDSFSYENERIVFETSGADAMPDIFEYLFDQQILTDNDLPIILNSNRWLVSKDPELESRSMNHPVPISNEHMFVDTNMSNPRKKKEIRKTIDRIVKSDLGSF